VVVIWVLDEVAYFRFF